MKLRLNYEKNRQPSGIPGQSVLHSVHPELGIHILFPFDHPPVDVRVPQNVMITGVLFKNDRPTALFSRVVNEDDVLVHYDGFELFQRRDGQAVVRSTATVVNTGTKIELIETDTKVGLGPAFAGHGWAKFVDSRNEWRLYGLDQPSQLMVYDQIEDRASKE